MLCEHLCTWLRMPDSLWREVFINERDVRRSRKQKAQEINGGISEIHPWAWLSFGKSFVMVVAVLISYGIEFHRVIIMHHVSNCFFFLLDDTPETCIYSNWSPWSACSSSTCEKGKRMRQRMLKAQLDLSVPCPETQDFQPCMGPGCSDEGRKEKKGGLR